jgi:shikimate kinase
MIKKIVITGFMGSGKTNFANALSQRLKCEMLDLDWAIKNREGRTAADIIQQDGEAAFRAIETEALRDALEQSAARVIALGGGTWTIERNRELIAHHNCLTVWLDTPFELCWQRISAAGDGIRPLAPDVATARSLFESRRAGYGLAKLQVQIAADTDVDKAVDQIESLLATEALNVR